MELSTGSGRTAFEQSAATLPGVSAPSSVVRSIIRTASSNAWSFESFLIERFASVAARSSSATASTEPIRGSRGSSGSSNPRGSAGACDIRPVYVEAHGTGPPGHMRGMKWRGRGGGGRIEDRRGAGGSLGGGGIPLPLGKAGGGGLGLIILLVAYLLFGGLPGGGGGLGVDPGTGQFGQAPTSSEAELEKAPADDAGKFVDFVAGDVDATWKKIFSESGKAYEPATVVLYDDAVSTGCGNSPSTIGPFYCPRDRKVYLDLPFLDQLQQE